MTRLKATLFGAVAAASLTLMAGVAHAATEVRIMWYNDGGEGEVVRDLLDRYEKAHPDIKIVLDVVPYKTVLENLPAQLASGSGPDMARVTDLGGLSANFLDVGPLLKDRKYFEDNFVGTLPWLRPAGKTDGVYGLMTQLTLTIGFANATLFQQAGIPMPAAGATWADWAKATNAVAKKLNIAIPMAMDRSGHRMSPGAISMGAKMFDGDKPALTDAGFKTWAQMLVDWHKDGTMSKDIWGSVGGTSYKGANEEFANGKVVFYYSGTWQIPQFAKTIKDGFDWQAVAEPCGPAACTGMPGGAALVGIKTTKNPQAVADILEYLASEPVYSEYHARTLFLPASAGLAKKGVPFKTDLAQVKTSLETATAEVAKLSPVAYKLQGYISNKAMFNAEISRINQVIAGEMTLDDGLKRMDSDIAEALAAKK